MFYDLWKKAPGTELEKLIALGIVDLDSEWNMRMMGDGWGNADERPQDSKHRKANVGIPFAFVLEKARQQRFAVDNSDRTHQVQQAPGALSNKRFIAVK